MAGAIAASAARATHASPLPDAGQRHITRLQPAELDTVGHQRSSDPQFGRTAVPQLVWIGLLVLLGLWAAYRIGAFDLWQTVVAGDGRRVRLPDAFASVDHPFHVVRAETLRRALADGHPLRWIGHHQGGYPVEFYPLGVAWLEVGLWGLLLGALPMALVHKFVIVLLFLLPGLVFALMARRDALPLGVALVALAAHVAVPGAWWHGGYTELVEWGLVTNVAAATSLLFVLLWLTAYLDRGGMGAAAGASLAAAFAVSTNPRALIALGVVGLGVWLAVTSDPARRRRPMVLAARLALVAGLTAALAAPELVALLRFEDLYYFVHYGRYDAPSDYLRSTLQAISTPVLPFAVGGVVVGLALPGRVVTRATAVTLVLYVAATVALSFGPLADALLQQLETTRLMPFQRLLSLYLAAVALHALARWFGAGVPTGTAPVTDLILLGAAVVLLLATPVVPAAGAGEVVPADRSLYRVTSSAAPVQADFEAAVEAADAAAPPGTALLVLGSALSWHQPLWAPLVADRPFFYDDWLWYWQTRHYGDYDPTASHAYPVDASALDPEYLSRHGIGAVVVAGGVVGSAADVAARSAELEPVGGRFGPFDVYAVRAPTAVVTLAGANASRSDLGNQRLTASGASAGGEALVRRNWHPRWRAWVNGEPAPISQTADGYMTVPVPAGEVRIELRYAVDRLDWLGRLLCGAGMLVVGRLLVGRRRFGQPGGAVARQLPAVAPATAPDADRLEQPLGAGAGVDRLDEGRRPTERLRQPGAVGGGRVAIRQLLDALQERAQEGVERRRRPGVRRAGGAGHGAGSSRDGTMIAPESRF